jgi:hypothetical protein
MKSKILYRNYPPTPRAVDDVKIEGIWRNTLSGEPFILLDLKYPIFGIIESLKQLSICDSQHLYSIHSLHNDL